MKAAVAQSTYLLALATLWESISTHWRHCTPARSLPLSCQFDLPRSTILNIFCLHESSRIIDRKATVAQPAITRTMIVPHIVFTMLATG